MKTAGKTMKKQVTQPRTKKKCKKHANLIPRPFGFRSAHSSLFNILSKVSLRHSLTYCRNCPYLFDGFYPRTGTSSIFPSAAHCLDISPDFPGFLQFSHSLFTCCSPILSSTKTSPVLVQSRHAQVSAKAHTLAMQGRQPPMGGQSLIIRGFALESSSYPVSSGYLFQWRHRISDVSSWEPTV